MTPNKPHPMFKLATELGPLVIFFLANAKFGLFAATGAFMVAIVAAIAASYVATRHVPIMALVTAAIVLVFGTLTLVLHDETFIKLKPTIVYALFSATLFGGMIFGRSLIAVMFDQMFNLTAEGWRILTMRWAVFFAVMAVVNEVVWRTQSNDFWVGFKLFGFMPMTMIFAMAQMPLINRFSRDPATAEADDAARGKIHEG
ncbi:MAG TPA: septation protein A [Xanthobacteraceae bacterium]|nr:septation protein A [Xanthobacteraceae bacterium]